MPLTQPTVNGYAAVNRRSFVVPLTDDRLKSTSYNKHCDESHVSKVKGHDEILDELFGEFGVHLKDIEKVIAVDLVKVTVGQRADVATRLADRFLIADVLTEDVFLSCKRRTRSPPIGWARQNATSLQFHPKSQ